MNMLRDPGLDFVVAYLCCRLIASFTDRYGKSAVLMEAHASGQVARSLDDRFNSATHVGSFECARSCQRDVPKSRHFRAAFLPAPADNATTPTEQAA
jgi:hypothetical protein